MTATTRACLTCATPITVTTRNPNRRFCSPRCRVADWHARNDPPRRPDNDVPNDVPNVVTNDVTNNVNDVPNDVPNIVTNDVTNNVNDVPNDVPPSGNAAPSSGSVTRCPRCQTPLTVLTWLLPPAAAHVAIPPAPRHG